MSHIHTLARQVRSKRHDHAKSSLTEWRVRDAAFGTVTIYDAFCSTSDDVALADKDDEDEPPASSPPHTNRDEADEALVPAANAQDCYKVLRERARERQRERERERERERATG